ncbi:putative class 3 lipase [Zostera marina]|uniref:Putative class 3 lipase n=1 Tax=Zostera marina TaxID=29655 RepID=A0A0K9PVM0_ZOSMR|nr:putative class 3 lipase [Zostera marina]
MGRSCRGLDRRRCAVALGFLLCFFSALDAREIESRHDFFSQIYNHTVATILVEYASAVYISDLTELFTWTCSRCNGKIEAFEIVSIIVDVKNCLQAFVGVDKNLNSIVVAFRGTQEHSIQNWIEDLFWKQLDLNYPGMPDAMVHHGFYYAYHNTTLRDGILDGILHAKNLYGDIGIVVTGHSMGGAIASFCALDLAVNYKVKTVQLMTFGQPRIGNEIFSSYFSEHVPHAIRVTNRNDMVPHLPPYYYFFPSKTYHHFPREVWIYDIILGSLVYEAEKICDSSGEDPNCSRSVSGNSLTDHLCYFGVDLEAETWRACNIVLNLDTPNLLTDHNGNFVVYRSDISPFIKSPMENYRSLQSS